MRFARVILIYFNLMITATLFYQSFALSQPEGCRSGPGFLRNCRKSDETEPLQKNEAKLRYCGRGTVEFTIKKPGRPYVIHLNEHNFTVTGAWVDFSNLDFNLSYSPPFPEGAHLTDPPAPWLRLWLSFSCRRKAFIKVGYGHLMQINTLFEFSPKILEGKEECEIDPFISQLMRIRLDDQLELVEPPHVIADPITLDPSPFLIAPQNRRREHDNQDDSTFYLPVANLPLAARGLFEQVQNFELSAEEIKAIQYSIVTEGRFLNKERKRKEQTSNLPGYLRAQLHEPRRTAPGQEMVLEIWLPNRASPIHNHGDTSGIIKVLHGEINSEWFNPIMDGLSQYSKPILGPLKLHAGQYTWLTDSVYQTHRLNNTDPTNVAISIQSYAWEDDARERLDYFFYINESCVMHNPHVECHKDFFPEYDFHFNNITGIVMQEYKEYLACSSNNAATFARFRPLEIAFCVVVLLLNLSSGNR